MTGFMWLSVPRSRLTAGSDRRTGVAKASRGWPRGSAANSVWVTTLDWGGRNFREAWTQSVGYSQCSVPLADRRSGIPMGSCRPAVRIQV